MCAIYMVESIKSVVFDKCLYKTISEQTNKSNIESVVVVLKIDTADKHFTMTMQTMIGGGIRKAKLKLKYCPEPNVKRTPSISKPQMTQNKNSSTSAILQT